MDFNLQLNGEIHIGLPILLSDVADTEQRTAQLALNVSCPIYYIPRFNWAPTSVRLMGSPYAI